MEDLIKIIKNEVEGQDGYIDVLTLIVLFSEGHIIYNILVDGKEINYEIGVEKALKISEYVNKFTESHNSINRLTISINHNKVSRKFDFDEDYYVSINQGLLNAIVEKRKDNLNIETQELKDLLSIAKYALTKVDIKELVSEECKLYLVIESCQLATNIHPNFIKDNNKYLFLCEILNNDILQLNIEGIVLRKIEQTYKWDKARIK